MIFSHTPPLLTCNCHMTLCKSNVGNTTIWYTYTLQKGYHTKVTEHVCYLSWLPFSLEEGVRTGKICSLSDLQLESALSLTTAITLSVRSSELPLLKDGSVHPVTKFPHVPQVLASGNPHSAFCSCDFGFFLGSTDK